MWKLTAISRLAESLLDQQDFIALFCSLAIFDKEIRKTFPGKTSIIEAMHYDIAEQNTISIL